MTKIISKKISVKASESNPLGKPPPWDKTFGIDREIRFCAIEYDDETEEGEESEILVVYDSSLAGSNQNFVNRQFPYIDMFDHEGPVVINAMRDSTSVLLTNLTHNF